MAVPSRRLLVLWAVIMLTGLAAAGLYVRANLPQLPGVYWLLPHPSNKTLADLEHEAKPAPAYQRALNDAETAVTEGLHP